MGGHPDRRLLMAWHDGEVDDAEGRRLALHCDACARCRRYVDDLQMVATAVRGEPVPARYLANRPAWATLPWSARVVPGLAVAASLVALVVAVGGPGGDRFRGEARHSVASQVGLPEAPAPRETPGTGGQGATPVGGPGRPAVPPDQPGAGDPGDGGPAVAGEEEAGPFVVGVVVPGGADGPGAPMVDAVRRALAAANRQGGVDGRPFELWVGDATDPAVVDVMVDAGVRALVGGSGLSPELRQAFAERAVSWFGPTDVVEPAHRLVPLEVPHAVAGRLLGEAAAADGQATAFVVTRDGVAEAGLGTGVSEVLAAAGTTTLEAGQPCDAALQAAAPAAPDVLVLALPPEDVGACLGSLDPDGPLQRVVIPATAADEALARDLSGLHVTAALGAPNPKDLTAAVTRFRQATGLVSGYRALASFAAAELAVDAIRRDPERPYRSWLVGGPFRSDMLIMDPQGSPYNQGARVAQLGGSPVG